MKGANSKMIGRRYSEDEEGINSNLFNGFLQRAGSVSLDGRGGFAMMEMSATRPGAAHEDACV